MTLAARDALLSRLSRQPWPHGPLLDSLKLPPAADVLDVGAGNDGLLSELRSRGHTGRLAGVDPHAGEGIQMGVANALPFPADSFDTVLFMRVQAHLPDVGAALAEARRVLRPGGQLVIAAHGPEHLRVTWAALGQAQTTSNPLPDGPPDLSFTVRPLNVRVPVVVSAADALTLARSYGLAVTPESGRFSVQDALHLAGFTWTATGA